MENLLNLQLFVDEVDTGSEADQGTEQETEQEQEIPADLAGIDEETAREIMKEMQPDGTAEEETEEETSEEESTEPPADADSDNETVDEVLDEPNKAIPYKRFKEVNDKAKAREQEIEQLRQQLAAMQNGQPTAPVQQQQQVQQPAIQKPQINAELAVQIDSLAYQEALKMTGLTKEDVEVLEYADAGDPKVQAWNASLSFAKNRAWSAVDTELKNIQYRQQQQVQMVQASNQEYLKFEQEQAAQADFPKVRDYAVGEFFNSLSPLDQQAVTAAWSRVEAKQCSPQDVFLIKQYFEKASTDYRGKNPLPVKQDKIKNTTEKIKQMGKHPKVSQIEGSPSSANGLTVDKLEQMVNEKNWDEIPEDIQKVILNGGTL